MKHPRHPGMSLMEVSVAILITGVLAVLMIPKFLSSSQEITAGKMSRAEQILQSVSMSIQLYEDITGTPLSESALGYDEIYRQYGSYFFHKGSNNFIHYYLLADGSRLTSIPELFSAGATSLPEYNPAPLSTSRWGNPPGSAVGYCGSFSDDECLYLDINGKEVPNQVGKAGDIIPFRIERSTGKLRTLYQWMSDSALTQAEKCLYVSSYDVYTNPAIDALCP